MRRSLPLIVALFLIVATGYVHGRLTNRWSGSPATAEAVAKVARLPMEIGPWRGQEYELDAAVLKRAGIDGYAGRRYVDPRSGAAVTILFVCGRPGPISAHTPEVCYPGAGYEPQGEAVRRSIPVGGSGPPAEFLVCDFARPAVPASPTTRILWSWNGGAGWETSRNPRLSFARYPNLYKLYVLSERTEKSGDDPVPGFLELLLPALQSILTSK
jgi:hypothetical protein